MTNILIVGGAGFIGSNIVKKLVDLKYNITVFDNLSTGYLKNIKYLIDQNKIKFIYGDITNLESCRKACKNIDIICHQAALGSVPRSIIDPLSSHNSNVNGFLNMLISAKENGIKRFVYASSSSVYGDEITLPKIENKVGNVLSPYAATKKINEIYANIFTKCYGFECIGLRYFNVFGPNQDPNGAYAAVIPKFIDLLKNNNSPIINGNGYFSRDFTYVSNVVDVNILALTTTNNACFGKVLNVGAGGRVTILKLFNVLKKNLNSDCEPIFGEERNGDIPHSNANISLLENLLNYKPKINFEEGIKLTLKFYLDN